MDYRKVKRINIFFKSNYIFIPPSSKNHDKVELLRQPNSSPKGFPQTTSHQSSQPANNKDNYEIFLI